MIRFDTKDVEAARQGNRAALDGVVRAAQGPVYNLALRMLAHPTDAEDATQEILIKIVTNLGGIRDIEAAGGWAMRIACRHLVAMRKHSRTEALRLSFDDFSKDLETGLDMSAVSASDDVETRLAIEEVKVGCTLAMLTCLNRGLRIAYLLGDVFELTDTEAALVLEVTPATYRQRLSRARKSVMAFVVSKCGNVSPTANCRCERRVEAATACGRVVKGVSAFGLEADKGDNVPKIRAEVQNLEEGRRAAALMRSNPNFTTNVGELVLSVVGSTR